MTLSTIAVEPTRQKGTHAVADVGVVPLPGLEPVPRRTKIVATLGPATDDDEALAELLSAGTDVVRINFSHGSADEHLRQVARVRRCANRLGREVGVLADLQGPKIRIEGFREGPVILREGQTFALDAALPPGAGDERAVGVAYRRLPEEVESGDTLLLDDGRVVLEVSGIDGSRVHCRVVVGGLLSDRKGLNRRGGGLSAPALTDKDRNDIETAVRMEADYLAVSFPRSANDVEQARDWLTAAGGQAAIVAKIERAEALSEAEAIIDAADAIMIARGDLGVEIGDAALPAQQKRLISLARSMNRVVITATQMMESMVENPIPTRAEVFDVANAVLDGTDAIMLSAESATGRYPHLAVEAMDRACRTTEQQQDARRSKHRLHSRFHNVDEAIAMATMYAANHLRVGAIVALTESGSTPLWLSRISSGMPIYALSRHVATRRRATLLRGVYPIAFDPDGIPVKRIVQKAVEQLITAGAAGEGDSVIITYGDQTGYAGGTNTLQIVRVGDDSLPTEPARRQTAPEAIA